MKCTVCFDGFEMATEEKKVREKELADYPALKAKYEERNSSRRKHAKPTPPEPAPFLCRRCLLGWHQERAERMEAECPGCGEAYCAKVSG